MTFPALKDPTPHIQPAPESLEALLLDLVRYGRPRISLHLSGWGCCVEMNTNAEGASFDIRSDFGHSGPLAAARQCLDRVQKAVATIRGA